MRLLFQFIDALYGPRRLTTIKLLEATILKYAYREETDYAEYCVVVSFYNDERAVFE